MRIKMFSIALIIVNTIAKAVPWWLAKTRPAHYCGGAENCTLTTFVQNVRSWKPTAPTVWPHNPPQRAAEQTETLRSKSDGKQADWSGYGYKELKIVRKKFQSRLVRMRSPVQIWVAAPKRSICFVQVLLFLVFGGSWSAGGKSAAPLCAVLVLAGI